MLFEHFGSWAPAILRQRSAGADRGGPRRQLAIVRRYRAGTGRRAGHGQIARRLPHVAFDVKGARRRSWPTRTRIVSPSTFFPLRGIPA